jgi:hypothetical protein
LFESANCTRRFDDLKALCDTSRQAVWRRDLSFRILTSYEINARPLGITLRNLGYGWRQQRSVQRLCWRGLCRRPRFGMAKFSFMFGLVQFVASFFSVFNQNLLSLLRFSEGLPSDKHA